MDNPTSASFEMDVTTPARVGLCAKRLERVTRWMHRYVEKGKLPGLLTLVARHGQVAYLQSVGMREVETSAPITNDTLFRIYSMSKPVTSAAVMMLYEEGAFQLDHPVAKYLPELENPAVYVAGEGEDMRTEPARGAITIQHLLTHTSGFTYGFFNDSPVAALYKEHTTDFGPQTGALPDVVARLSKLPLVAHPGSEWNYGVSTDVLGLLVERVSGQRYDRFLQERLFDPLGMHDTAFTVPAAEGERLAALYGPDPDDGMRLVESSSDSVYKGDVTTHSGGGGLISTVADYYRFLQMLRGAEGSPRVLAPKTIQFMTCNHLPGDLASMGQATFNETTFEGIGFGLGFSIMLDPARAAIIGSPGEYAWGGAASTAFWVDPVEDLVVILMTQLLPSSYYNLRRELRVLAYQALVG